MDVTIIIICIWSKLWKIVIKYIASVVLFGFWFVGIFDLFADAKIFEVVIDVNIMVLILVISFIFTNKNSSNQ